MDGAPVRYVRHRVDGEVPECGADSTAPSSGAGGTGTPPASLEDVCERPSSSSRMVRALPHPRGDPRRVRARADRRRQHRLPRRAAGHPGRCRSAAHRAGGDRAHPGARGRRLRPSSSRRRARRSRPSSRPCVPDRDGASLGILDGRAAFVPGVDGRVRPPERPRLHRSRARRGRRRHRSPRHGHDRASASCATSRRPSPSTTSAASSSWPSTCGPSSPTSTAPSRTYALVAAGALAIIGLVGLRDGRAPARADPPAAARRGGDHRDPAGHPHPGRRARRRVGADRHGERHARPARLGADEPAPAARRRAARAQDPDHDRARPPRAPRSRRSVGHATRPGRSPSTSSTGCRG